MKTARKPPVWVVVSLFVLGIGLILPAGFAQTEEGTAAKKPTISQPDLEKMQRRLDHITENHHALTQALEEIKAELAIIKVRVTI